MEFVVGESEGDHPVAAVRYRDVSKTGKAAVLDSVCAVTGFFSDYARRALRNALRPKIVVTRAPREPRYGAAVVGALEKCWAVLNAPAGERLAPMHGELVPVLRRVGELDIDRRLAPTGSRLELKGRSHTKPGLAAQITDCDADLG